MDNINKLENCDFITSKNMEERLNPFFEKFSPLKKNFCADCLGLKEVQSNEDEDSKKTCDLYLMDTGICSKCGKTNEVLNPFIYATAKLNHIDNVYGNAPRIYFNPNLFASIIDLRPECFSVDAETYQELKIKYQKNLFNKYLTRTMIMLIIAIPTLIYLMWLNFLNLSFSSSFFDILTLPLQGFILTLLILMINKEAISIFKEDEQKLNERIFDEIKSKMR
ncbi:hypothetical protein [Aliarcobacter butzleri]|uniref:hypothetical protein n=1 Tax=Aliarcobacter butzleri TaxID=28197 RepID=UPI001269CDFA|nr:hypothetical protein [Aliarcobacter butzleri]